MRNFSFTLTLLSIIVGINLSCTKIDKKAPINIEDIADLRAIIVSEGQFTYGTGSLTTISQKEKITQDVFRILNSRPLGDVPQSLKQIGNYYYIPVNNSRKIEVINSKTFKSVETMVLDTNVIPMYIEHLGGDSIIVSDQSSSAIAGSPAFSSLLIVDINHNQPRKIIKKSIKVNFPTFQMKVVEKKLFVAGSSFSVFDLDDINENSRRDVLRVDGSKISVSDFAKICIDKNGLIWVLTANSVVCVNPETETAVHEVAIEGINTMWGSLDIDPKGENIYLNSKNKVYSVNVDNPITPTIPVITHDNNDEQWTTYTLGVSKENTIFMVRVQLGFSTRGRVFEYRTDGKIAQKHMDDKGIEQPYFRAGVFPHHIHFL